MKRLHAASAGSAEGHPILAQERPARAAPGATRPDLDSGLAARKAPRSSAPHLQRRIAGDAVPSPDDPATPPTRRERVLALARWAPSGDNTQPWRFEMAGDSGIVVHGFDTRDHCVYDLDGHASQLAIGALLETIGLAASGERLRASCTRRRGLPDATPTFDIALEPDPGASPSPLIAFIPRRAVQRRAMATRPLAAAEKKALEASLGPAYGVLWIEGLSARLQAARLMFANAKIRLTTPEAYRVHREIIEWNAGFSTDKVPDRAIGLDLLSLRLMRFAMSSWRRVRVFNRFLAGTWVPRLELDWLPSLACAAHFALVTQAEPATVDDYVAAGRALQRFWLTATRLGLSLQPEMTPLIFSRYVRHARAFTSVRAAWRQAETGERMLRRLLGDQAAPRAVFMGRIGAGPVPVWRSLRRPLADLMLGRAPPHARTPPSAGSGA
ncbi:MAG: molybdopterin biosynthesis protein MoeY [Betaproteobacteria bacterium]|nr:molybdopterin biosynthesis protein MoeY [Betaproteobacteria bacterium]